MQRLEAEAVISLPARSTGMSSRETLLVLIPPQFLILHYLLKNGRRLRDRRASSPLPLKTKDEKLIVSS
jgi:hypothetical protein